MPETVTLEGMTTTTTVAAAPARGDFTTIGLIGLAHGTSHFFHMLLPPLFPTFIREFGLSYSQLGLLRSEEHTSELQSH